MNERTYNSGNLFLIGFMGAGKSSIGPRVAEKLEMPFMDSDAAIEAFCKKSIKSIFEKDGEAYFRSLERRFVETLPMNESCVIACGGGLPVASDMLDMLKALGSTVGLLAKPETIYTRVGDDNNRPMLKGKISGKQKTIASLLSKREAIYRSADFTVEIDGLSIKDGAMQVAKWYYRRFS